jgi:hypothetical protein
MDTILLCLELLTKLAQLARALMKIIEAFKSRKPKR